MSWITFIYFHSQCPGGKTPITYIANYSEINEPFGFIAKNHETKQWRKTIFLWGLWICIFMEYRFCHTYTYTLERNFTEIRFGQLYAYIHWGETILWYLWICIFKEKSHSVIHIHTHTGGKPHSGEVCGPAVCRIHIWGDIRHTQEKIYNFVKFLQLHFHESLICWTLCA